MEIFAAIRHNSAAYRVAEALRLPKLRSLTIALHPSGCQREGSLTMRCLWLVGLSLAASVSAAESAVDYQRDVKPILRARCFSCHGALKQESGLRLDTGALIRQGGDSGPALVPGEAANSLVLRRITATDESERMPPEGKPLTKEQIAVIRSWIAEGAESPPGEQAATDPRQHWSFQPPVRPSIPVVTNTNWVRNPIDAFIAAAHQKHGLTPLPPAKKSLLLRRVYLDLIGLPPNREQLRTFLSDDSPDAYERVVDQLLESRHYGERWGRHWMDVWRYSDWYGRRQVNDVRNSYPHIWRWRDWIIHSLNEDKGYDQMVREMLAADELYPTDDRRLPALGFIVRNWFSLNYHTWKQDLVEHTSKAFLGLRLNCAHCHDHKYDPISQEEYFRFRAFFEPLEFRHDRVPGGPALAKYIRYKPGSGASLKPIAAGLARVYDDDLDAETHMYRLGDTRDQMNRPPVLPGAPAIMGGDQLTIQAVQLPPTAWYPGLKAFVRRDETERREQAVKAAQAQLAKAVGQLESLKTQLSAAGERGTQASELVQQCEAIERAIALHKAQQTSARLELIAYKARVSADRARYGQAEDSRWEELAGEASRKEREARLAEQLASLAAAEQANFAARTAEKRDDKGLKESEQKLMKAQKAVEQAQAELEKSSAEYTTLGPQYPRTSTGRRSALAIWMTNREHPRTARVAVNHIWMRHFGRPLVPSVADFGISGKLPSHPELLDWLAVELMEPTSASVPKPGWTMKHLHRLIVTSSTYRMSSRPGRRSHPNFQADKDNVYWWRFERRRVEAEIVRDAMLHVAGALDLTIGGQEIDPQKESESRRRSLYFAIYPEAGGAMRFMTLFDPPNPTDCYRRSESIVPQQALAMANSAVALNQGRQLAEKLSQEIVSDSPRSSDDRQFIVAAFEQILCRQPSAREEELCVSFLAKQRVLYQTAGPDRLHAKPLEGVEPAAEDPWLRGRESLVRSLLNHNDFVTVH